MSTLFIVIISALAGIFAGMGMGGGTILLPFLILFANYTQLQAQSINLVAFLPLALFALYLHKKNNLLVIKGVWILALFGVVGSCLGALFAKSVDTHFLKICYGLFLIILGTFQLSKTITQKHKQQTKAPPKDKTQRPKDTTK